MKQVRFSEFYTLLVTASLDSIKSDSIGGLVIGSFFILCHCDSPVHDVQMFVLENRNPEVEQHFMQRVCL